MQNQKTQIMVEGAAMVAMATVLSLIKVYQLPWGGSITLLSMLPIVLFSIRRGVKAGMLASFVYSLIALFQGIAVDGLFGWGLTPVSLIGCIFLDYLLAFSVLGIAGMFRTKGFPGWVAGIALAVIGRFIMHFISGAVIFGSFGELWNGFSTDNCYLYSFLYNGSYMLPELALTLIGAVVLLKLPQTKKIILKSLD